MFTRILYVLGALVTFVFVGAIFFRGCCVTFVDNYEVGYRYDKLTGKLSRVGRTGYIVHLPIVTEVHTVDTRPMQVCINANARVLNCKLVQFNPDGLETFVAWHGRNDYDNDPTSSTTGSTPSQLNSILMSYAFENSGRCTTQAEPSYPFLRVLRDLKPEEAGSQTAPQASP